MSLVARHLEANGIPTVVLGSAIDIVEYCSVPRYAHVDFPLGNPCGKPFDEPVQREIAQDALALFANAEQSNTTVRLPYQWSDDQGWRNAYARVDEDNRERLLQLGEQRRQEQTEKKHSLARIEFDQASA